MEEKVIRYYDDDFLDLTKEEIDGIITNEKELLAFLTEVRLTKIEVSLICKNRLDYTAMEILEAVSGYTEIEESEDFYIAIFDENENFIGIAATGFEYTPSYSATQIYPTGVRP